MGLITFVVLADSSRSSYVFGLLTLSLRILLGLHVSLVLLHFEGSAGSSYVLDLITLSFEVF